MINWYQFAEGTFPLVRWLGSADLDEMPGWASREGCPQRKGLQGQGPWADSEVASDTLF